MPETTLLIARHWPEPASTAAGRRTLDLLDILAGQGQQIHLASAAEPSPFQADLTALGYQCHNIALNDAAFDDWLGSLKPDLVIFDRFVSEEQFGWRVREQVPEAVTVLDTSDLHCLRYAREQSVKKQQPLQLFNDLALREIAAIVRCDLTLMISEFETELLQQQFRISPDLLEYLPFLVTPDQIQPGPEFEARQHLIMMGGFKHEPNRDATRWLRDTIWPAIRARLPKGIEMHVYGAYADHAMMQLHQPAAGFFIKGRAENALQTFQQYRVNLAPLRFGAGQKGKILEGWLTGTPTITNPVGAEAMSGDLQLGYPLTDSVDGFADAAAMAYLNRDVWHRISDCGQQILKQRFLRPDHDTRLIERLTHLRQNLNMHRENNFWGRMLWQQQYRSQEFMSRWIETKNKLQRVQQKD